MTTKQIYGVFGITTILFLIIGFLVAQNIQNYGKSSTANSNLTNNSSQNSSNNSANPNSKSSLSQNSNSTTSSTNSTSFKSQTESQNPNFITTSSSNSKASSNSILDQNLVSNSVSTNSVLNSQTSQVSPNSSPKITKFGSNFRGKVGESSIKMTIDKIEQKQVAGQTYFETLIFGSYSYNSQNKPIELRGKYDHGNQLGSIILEEFVDSVKTGEFSTAGNPNSTFLNSDFYENKFSKIEGKWTNAKTGEKLDFEVIREGSDAKADSYYQDQKTEPILTPECKENMKTLNNSPNLIIIDINFDEQIIAHRCNQGAYQSSYNFNYLNKKTNQKKFLELPNFDPETKKLSDKNNSEICIRYHEWNEQNKTLVINCSGRGLNDCGSQETYKWLENEKKFELILVKYQGECVLDKPENQKKNQEEQQEILKNLKFPVVYQK